MASGIAIPVWAFVALVFLALVAVLDRVLVPSVRWVIRRRLQAAVEKLNRRLRIEIPPFQLTRRRVLIDRLLFDPQVIAATEAYGREQNVPGDVALARVRAYAREIVPSFNADAYFRVGYLTGRLAARALYRVRLGAVDEAAIASIPKSATVVVVMNHRSNMDYLLVGHLVAERTALSYAVGEWAQIWPLHQVLRAMGAYFVRRNSRDPLYRKVLERYIQMATAGGVPQAVYPEGGLSRDGKLREPKLGVLDYMLKAFDPAGERDIVFVPVGINYDRVLEDRTLLRDSGTPESRPPKKGPIAAGATAMGFAAKQLLLIVRQKWHRFGYACVHFGQPISAAAFLRRRGMDLRQLERDERGPHLQEFAAELMRAIGAAVPLLPVPLVATALLEHPEGLAELDLKAAVRDLIARAERHGGRPYVPRQDLDYAVSFGLKSLVLRHLVEEQEGVFRVRSGEAAVVRYYANSIEHLLKSRDAEPVPAVERLA
jgi:glycerol-3-phosphate O-acyltransferase